MVFNLQLENLQPKHVESSSESNILQSFHQRSSAACLSWAISQVRRQKKHGGMPSVALTRVCVCGGGWVCVSIHLSPSPALALLFSDSFTGCLSPWLCRQGPLT